MDDVTDFMIPEILIKCLPCAGHRAGSEGLGTWAQWEGGRGTWLKGLRRGRCGGEGVGEPNNNLKMACVQPERMPV